MTNLCHPVLENDPCPVLQHADDTLVFRKASGSAILSVKDAPDDFALSTGLTINYRKTAFLPVCVPLENACTLAGILGTPVSGFPQPYLVLPLTPIGLNLLIALP
jgi:hypothetical protein